MTPELSHEKILTPQEFKDLNPWEKACREFIKGCSCALPPHPENCPECLVGFLEHLQFLQGLSQPSSEVENYAEKHKARHGVLHAALDELFADYIAHNPNEPTYTEMPLIVLMAWSHKQADEPDHEF